jgi:hypothetical protein
MTSLRLALLLACLAWLAPQSARAFEHHHALGVGYQSGHISSETAGAFHLRALPFSYVGRYGGGWAALVRLSALLPLRARQGELKFAPRAEYNETEEWDSFVGVARRFPGPMGFDLDAALGAHFHYVRFRSQTYVEWSAAASGLGLGATARRVLFPRLWGGRGEWGAAVDMNYDFIDISRGGDLRSGVQVQCLAFVGWAWGAQ